MTHDEALDWIYQYDAPDRETRKAAMRAVGAIRSSPGLL